MLAFGTNYAVSATGFWLSYAVPYLGSPTLAIWFAEGFLVLQVATTPLMGQRESVGTDSHLAGDAEEDLRTVSDFGSPSRRVMVVTLSALGSMGLIIAGSAKNMHVAIVGSVFYGFR